ncbi:MAG: hypothetical protein Q4E32_06050 [Bacteroidales bacterium]|nr:hypothetical protein [Bacteroidales bacterium]
MLYNSKRKKLCRHLLAGGAACLMGMMMFSCTDKYDLDEEQPSGYNTIYGYLQDRGNFSTYLRLIDDLGQADYLSKTGSITLFIANDEAFGRFFQSNDWGVTSYDQLSLSQKKLLLNTAMIGNVYPISMLSTASSGNTSLKGRAVRQYTTLGLADSVQLVKINKTETPTGEGGVTYTYDDDLPNNPHWNIIRANRDQIPLYKDASGTPTLLIFTPQYFDTYRLRYSDLDFLMGQPEGTLQAALNRNEPGAYVNGATIIESQFCKNGYIHEVDRVLTPLDNMAETIRKNSNVSAYSSLIERFAAPYYSKTVTDDYNMAYGTEYDSVFVKRYFSSRSAGSTDNEERPFMEDAYQTGMENDASLSFDPGWTRYVTPGAHYADDALKENTAVMLVPTNAALMNWWDKGGGKVIKEQYGLHPTSDCTDAADLINDMSATPSDVLDDLINVNMLTSVTGSVPSRFSAVLNDANEPLGLEQSHVSKVDMASNGLIYYTDVVYTPATYASVLFPALIRTDIMNVIYNAIKNDDYEAYLNSMVSNYQLLLPSNGAMAQYIDPVSFGQKNQRLFEFKLNDRQNTAKSKLYADVYNISINPEDGTWTKIGDKSVDRIGFANNNNPSQGGLNVPDILYRVEDIMDNMIAIGEMIPGKKYYPTKGNNFVRLEGIETKTASAMQAGGSYHTQSGALTTVQEFYDMSKETNGGHGNGYSYVVDEIPMSTWKSVTDVLKEHPEFSDFYDIVIASASVQYSISAPSAGNFYSASQASTPFVGQGNLVAHSLDKNHNDMVYQLLNNYHYTVYAPTNAAMAEAFAAGLPTMDQMVDADAQDKILIEEGKEPYLVDSISNVMRDFVRYHIQTNSIYMDEGFDAGIYESTRTLIELQDTIIDGQHTYKDKDGDGYFDCLTGSPYRIHVNSVSSTGISITDEMGNPQNIGLRSDGLYNLQAREYWLGNGNAGVSEVDKAINIANSSSVVIHAVEHPLFYNYDPSWETTDPEKFKVDQFHYVKREIVNNEE